MVGISKLLIHQDYKLGDALNVIDKGGHRIAIIVDSKKRLLGILTDYDVRKALLAGADWKTPIAKFINRKPVSAFSSATKKQIKKLMLKYKKDQIPLLDSSRRVVGLETGFELMTTPVSGDCVAVIMAGGQGQRLRPLTSKMPKPLLPIQEKPLLEIILKELKKNDIDKIFISINYFGATVREKIGSGKRFDADIKYLEEDKPLGTAGALSLLPSNLDHPIIVMNGDLLTRVSFNSLIRYHNQSENAMTVCVRKYAAQVPYGVVDLNESRVTGVREKPVHRHFVNAGIYVLDPSVIRRIPQDTPYDMTQLIADLLAEGQTIGSFPVHEYWLDIGRVADYERAHEDYERHFSTS